MTLSHIEAAGLPIVESCEGCGVCCLQTVVPPYIMKDGIHEAVTRQVPEKLIAEIMPFWEIRFHLPERPCMWFDSEMKSCRHYEHRPQACRDFELNSTFCHAIRARWNEE